MASKVFVFCDFELRQHIVRQEIIVKCVLITQSAIYGVIRKAEHLKKIKRVPS